MTLLYDITLPCMTCNVARTLVASAQCAINDYYDAF